MKIHINWGMCGDWYAVRGKLIFLKVRLHGNFCDTEGDIVALTSAIERRGLKVERDGNTLRLS